MFAFLYRNKLLFSIGLLSAAIISFQLALMQILSIVQWYHFAYMVISVALLGFGAAGTVLSIFRNRLLEKAEWLLPFLMLATAVSMALVTDISQQSFIRFDSYLLFAEYSHIGRLLLTYLLFFIPFFLGALAIGLIFVKNTDTIGKIYFANLLGSGLGGLLALGLIWLFFARQLPAFISILPLLAALVIFSKKKKYFLILFACLTLAIISWKVFQPPKLILSQFKDISKALLLPEANIDFENTSPYGLVQTVKSPVLRYAPGLSLTAHATAPIKMAVFINGDWLGPVIEKSKTDTGFILDYTTMALPYKIGKRNKVLVLKAGTGIDVSHALSMGSESITAVEPNSALLSLLKTKAGNNSIFNQPEVTIHNVEPRTFLMTDTAHYELISLPMAGSFGGSAGLQALQEQFIFTKEAIRRMWQKLSPGGVISINSWMDYPARYPYRILASLVEVLEDLGISSPRDHIVAIRSWGTISFVMKRTPLSDEEIQNTRAFCEEMQFDAALLPGLMPGERMQYNQLQDSVFFNYVDTIFSAHNRENFYSGYDFNIQPVTDNRPYFSQFLRLNSLNRLAGFFGNRTLPFLELGYLLVIITLIQIVLVSFFLIILPLFKLGWKRKNGLLIFFYFGGIAMGYMFVEMIFIQRFILYFGNPVYSVSAIITSLLIFSGAGSYLSGYFQQTKKRMLMVTGSIAIILFLYSFILTPVLQQTINAVFAVKIVIVFLLTAPPAFLMGIPFPAGLSRLSKTDFKQIPWAWGLNGCISVISTALAIILSVETGFSRVMLAAALAYSVSWVALAKWR